MTNSTTSPATGGGKEGAGVGRFIYHGNPRDRNLSDGEVDHVLATYREGTRTVTELGEHLGMNPTRLVRIILAYMPPEEHKAIKRANLSRVRKGRKCRRRKRIVPAPWEVLTDNPRKYAKRVDPTPADVAAFKAATFAQHLAEMRGGGL